MKQILMSIKPEWVEKILNGEKTLEIRKTAPKEWVDYLNGKTDKKPEPTIVNIYCTKGDKEGWCMVGKGDNKSYFAAFDRNDIYNVNRHYVANGNVVAKFTLKEIEEIEWNYDWEDPYFYTKTKEQEELLESACIDDLEPYMRGCEGYAWHISDLEIFDKPKELREFSVTKKYKSCDKCPHHGYDESFEHCVTCEEQVPLKRAPQSWCYVEEEE